MDGIEIVLVLVRCSTGLLLCDTLPTDRSVYADPETCRSEASRLVRQKTLTSGHEVFMAKCRYRLTSSGDPGSRESMELLY